MWRCRVAVRCFRTWRTLADLISSVGSERRGWVMEVSDGFYGSGEGAIDETADVPATGGLYDSLLITVQ